MINTAFKSADEIAEFIITHYAVNMSNIFCRNLIIIDSYINSIAGVIVEVDIAFCNSADKLRLCRNETGFIVNVPNSFGNGADKSAVLAIAFFSVGVAEVICNTADDVTKFVEAEFVMCVNFGGANQVSGSVELNVAIFGMNVLFVVAEGRLLHCKSRKD